MRGVLGFLILSLVVAGLAAQEDSRKLYGDAGASKHLTNDQIDRWIFQGKKGETILVHVTSGAFDPVIQLVRKDGAAITEKIDDEGSAARFRVRLPAAGEYHVRVHAYKQRGGGNYRMVFERLMATPIKIGTRVTGTFPETGQAHHYFTPAAGEVLVLEGKGARIDWSVRDHRGATVRGWQETIPVTRSEEHVVTVRGTKGEAYSLVIRRAEYHDLRREGANAGSRPEAGLDVWRFKARPGEFRLIEVTASNPLDSRLIHVVGEKPGPGLQLGGGARVDSAFTTFPAGSKGNTIRYYVLFHRGGPYELQLLADGAVEYGVNFLDPTTELRRAGGPVDGRIDVGGTAFYTLTLKSGRMLNLQVGSEQFDPTARLYGPRGRMLKQNDDGGDHLDSAIALLIKRGGRYLLQVSSVGNGGGGAFRVRPQVTEIPVLAVGKSARGQIGEGGEAYWSFDGRKGESLIISARSSSCDMRVEVIGPDGVTLKEDDDHGVGTDSLLALRLPAGGRYILKVGSARGRGEYRLRLIGDEDG